MARAILGYALLSAISIIALSSLSGAYTVTLTGGCPLSTITPSHNYITFNLSNSGDGPAQQVAILPHIIGADTNASALLLAAINASSYNVSRVYLQNVSESGTYVDYFLVSYQQGSNTYVTTYPCMVYINKYSQSTILLSEATQRGNAVDVSLLNYGTYPIDANLSLIMSPLYETNGTAYKELTLAPGETVNTSFSIKPILGNSSYAAGVAAQYLHNGTHYAALRTLLLTSQKTRLFTFGMLELAIIAAIVVIVALIIASIFVSRKKKRQGKPAGQ